MTGISISQTVSDALRASREKHEKQAAEAERQGEIHRVEMARRCEILEAFLADKVKPLFVEAEQALQQAGFAAKITNGKQREDVTGNDYALAYHLDVMLSPSETFDPRMPHTRLGAVAFPTEDVVTTLIDGSTYGSNAAGFEGIASSQDALREFIQAHAEAVDWS